MEKNREKMESSMVEGDTKVVKKRGLAKSINGVVASSKMYKTVVVSISTSVMHPKYGKYIRHNHQVLAHDDKSQCQAGDLVRIVESPPISRLKHWRVAEVIEKAQQV
jgi:small subunit ribosomal protein S17